MPVPRRWKPEELRALRQLAGNVSVRGIARKLQASRHAVENQLRRMGLPTRCGSRHDWTRLEVQKLRLLVGMVPRAQAAELIGRSEHSVRAKAHSLGLDWRSHYRHLSAAAAGRALGVGETGFNGLVSRAGLEPRVWGHGRSFAFTWDELELLKTRLDAEARGELPGTAVRKRQSIPGLAASTRRARQAVRRIDELAVRTL